MKHIGALITVALICGLGLTGCPEKTPAGGGTDGEPPPRDARVEGSGGADDDAAVPEDAAPAPSEDMGAVAEDAAAPEPDAAPEPEPDAEAPVMDAAPEPEPDAAPEPEPDAAPEPEPEPDAAPEPEPDAAPEPMGCPGAAAPVPEEWPPPTPAAPYLMFGNAVGQPGDVVTIPVYMVGDVPAVGIQFEAHFDDALLAPNGPQGDPPEVFAGPDAAQSGHSVTGRAHPNDAPPCFIRVLGWSAANALFGDIDDDDHRHVANLAFIIRDEAPRGRAVVWPIDTTIAGLGGAINHGTLAGSVMVE